MPWYINTRARAVPPATVETVDEFETRKEAAEMVREYNVSDPGGSYYVSSRPTREWKESD